MNPKAALSIICSLALASCAGGVPSISSRAVAYNNEVATATNEIFLLNTVRAAKYLPVYYTRFTSLNVEGTVTAKTSLPFEIGPRSIDVLKVGPEISGTQKDGAALAVLDDQDFANGILTPVPDSTLKFFGGSAANAAAEQASKPSKPTMMVVMASAPVVAGAGARSAAGSC